MGNVPPEGSRYHPLSHSWREEDLGGRNENLVNESYSELIKEYFSVLGGEAKESVHSGACSVVTGNGILPLRHGCELGKEKAL